MLIPQPDRATMNAETTETKKFTQSAPCRSCNAPVPARGRGLLLRALLLREDETRPQDRTCEAASCARTRPRRLPTRGRAVRPREATMARRAGSPRLPTRGRTVRSGEAATARRASLPPAGRWLPPAACLPAYCASKSPAPEP